MKDKKIEEIIKYHSEGHALDFKREQYPIGKHPKKHEILKDFVALLNHPSDEEKYIICGIKEKNGVADKFYGIGDLVDEAKYQQFINSNIEPSVNFEYKQAEYKENNIAYFRIFNNTQRPYLIKKEVRNSLNPKQVEYYPGDGFIRTGTSTRRLTRKDFEDIYKKKYTTPDRKNDLKIFPYIKKSTNEELENLPINCIEVALENTSNKSIKLDIEMKIKKNRDFKIISEFDILKKLHEETNKDTNDLYFPRPITPIVNNVLINIQEKRDFYLIYGESINLKQNYKEEDIFSEYVFLLQERQEQIEVEIIIRSDDFTEGVMIEKFKLGKNE